MALENLKMVSENVKIESANKKMGDWSIDRSPSSLRTGEETVRYTSICTVHNALAIER